MSIFKGGKRKALLCMLSVLVILGILPRKDISVAALPEPATYKFTDIADRVKIMSRAALTANGFEADAAGGGIAFALSECSGTVTMNIDFSADCGAIGVIVNDDFDNLKTIKIEKKGNQNVVIAENLSLGNYNFEVVKMNAQYINTVVYRSVTANATVGTKPAQKKLKIEFYGDSISCGVGALCPTTQSLNPIGYYDHYYSSYNVYCARALDAEISTCGAPGYGFAYGYSTGNTQTLDTLMDKSLFNKNSVFDHSSFIADVVVFELGTNDTNYAKNKSLIVSDTFMYNTVQRYIDKVRSYNAGVWIVLMGTLGSGNFDLNDRLNGPYMRLDNAMTKAAALNEKVLFLPKLGITTSGGGWHPKASEAKIGGERLADYIRENVLNCTTPPTTVAKGEYVLDFDINYDDKLNVNDILVMRKYLALINKSRINVEKADFNGDGRVDMKDSIRLLRRLAALG